MSSHTGQLARLKANFALLEAKSGPNFTTFGFERQTTTMYIKIYFNDKPLFLCDNIDASIEPFIHHDDAVFIDELDSHSVKSMIHEMQEPSVHAGVFFSSRSAKIEKDIL